MKGDVRRALAGGIMTASLWLSVTEAAAQVVAEPANLTAAVPGIMTFGLHLAFPDDGVVLGGAIRFPVDRGVDIGARGGLWFRDDADDAPFVGADLRYGLLSRALTPGGRLSLTFAAGLGFSDPGPTVWKIPAGFIAGIGFGRGGGAAELFAHPRLELGISTGGDETDAELLFDAGLRFPIAAAMSGLVALRFGSGVFEEDDQVVVSVGTVWRL